MAEISLREYLEKVDMLLKSGKSDEVVLHSRQILKFYPRNVAASRYLGQAMVRGSDYEDAEPILRRVLAVFPDDVEAHSALSDYNNRLGKADEAIWHLERALEGAPNDPALVEKLRGLYQRYRQVEDPRFQLTTGAVARQYIRNGLYAQAIETLQATLEKLPRRVDLRLLLAQTLWSAGKQVEAGETALDVLDVLPYCLEANRILTLLWLAEGRPSDAQRYLNQIQEVDPYAALRLAQDTSPDDEVFTLPELDYRRIAETQVASENPDWLTDIDQTEIPEPAGIDDAAFKDELPENFLDELDEVDQAAPQLSSGHTGYTGLLSALDLPDEEDEGLVSEELPDWLMEAAPEQDLVEEIDAPEGEPDPLDWMQEAGTVLTDEEAEDLFALDASETQLEMSSDELEVDEQEVPDFFGGEAVAQVAQTEEENLPGGEDPLAWLEGSGIELVEESEQELEALVDQEEEMVYQDPATIDPLAWLGRSGVELVEEGEVADLFPDLPDVPIEEADIDWLQEDHIEEFTEAEAEQPVSTLVTGGQPADAEAALGAEDESLDWLEQAESIEMNAGMPEFGSPVEAVQPVEDDDLSWLRDDSILEEMLDIEELSDTGGLPHVEVEQPVMMDEPTEAVEFAAPMDLSSTPTDVLPGRKTPEEAQEEADWQAEMNEESPEFASEAQPDDIDLSSFEWLSEEEEEPVEPQASAEAAPDDLEWMTELPEEAPEWLAQEPGEILSESDAEGGPGWLVEEPGEQSGVSDAFSWLTVEDAESAMEDEMAADEEPRYQPEEDESPVEPAASRPEETPDWLTELEPSDEMGDEEVMEAEAEPADIPEWLSESAPTSEAEGAYMAVGEGMTEDVFDWIEAEESEPAQEAAPAWEAEVEVEAEPADIPDWLSESAPVVEEETLEEAEPVAEAGMMAEEEMPAWQEEAEVEAEPAGMPDWLSEAAPAAEDEAAFEAEEMVEPLEPVAETADVPDWMAEAAPAAEAEAFMADGSLEWIEETPEAESVVPEAMEPAAEMEREFAADEEALGWEEEVEAEAEPADIPDWLSEAAPAAEEDAELMAEGEMAGEQTFDWGDQQPASVTDSPEWLQDLESADETAEEEAVEWEPQAEAEPESAGIPDWLSEAAPVAEEDAEVVAAREMAGEETFDWVEEEEPEPAPATDSPDWLQGLVPAGSADGGAAFEWSDAEDSEPAAQVEEFAGMDEDEDLAEPLPPVRPAASIAQTRILPENDFGWTGEDEPEYERDLSPIEDAEEFGEYVRGDELDEKTLASAQTPPPADNAPDWLNAMVPGLDLDYDAVEDDRPIESTYVESQARRQQPDLVPAEPPASQDINWLNAIVEEETGPMRAIKDVPLRRSRQRFVFSRPPVWLRVLEGHAPDEDDWPDTADRDDDFELPDWLR